MRSLAVLAALLAVLPARAQDSWDYAFVPVLPASMPVRAQFLDETWGQAEAAFRLVEATLAGVVAVAEATESTDALGLAPLTLPALTRIGRAEMGLRATAAVRRAEGDAYTFCVEDLVLGDALKRARSATEALAREWDSWGRDGWDAAAFAERVGALRAALAQYERAARAVAPRRARAWAGPCEIPYGEVTVGDRTFEVR